MTFYAADAGIEVGRALLNDLKTVDSGNWDNLLAGNQCDWEDVNGDAVSATSVATGNPDGDMSMNPLIEAVGTPNVGPASFQLWVRDNDDLDGNDQVDTDNIIILTSTGSYQNATVRIETQVRYSGGGDQYAQEHYDTDSSGVAARESGTVADAQRW
jgi:hypothetical protein